jgi:integrase
MLDTLKGNSFENVNLRAAFCVAYHGFLRLGEFTYSNWSESSTSFSLTRGSVKFQKGQVIIHLSSSKTDQFRNGVDIPLLETFDATCPREALKHLFNKYPTPRSHPLFGRVTIDGHLKGNYFNRQWVVQKIQECILRAGLDPTNFSGHSFRRGAAHDAVAHGLEDSQIMTLGRWTSEAFRRYIGQGTARRLTISKTLVKAAAVNKVSSTSISTPTRQLRSALRK